MDDSIEEPGISPPPEDNSINEDATMKTTNVLPGEVNTICSSKNHIVKDVQSPWREDVNMDEKDSDIQGIGHHDGGMEEFCKREKINLKLWAEIVRL